MDNELDDSLDRQLAEATEVMARAKSVLEAAREEHDAAQSSVRVLTRRVALRDQQREKALAADRAMAARTKANADNIREVATRTVARMRADAPRIAALCRADADAGGNGCPLNVLFAFTPAQVSAIRACPTDQEAAKLSGLFVAHVRYIRERRDGYALRDLSSPPPKQRGRPSIVSDDDVRRIRTMDPIGVEVAAAMLGISLAYARQIRYRAVRGEVPDDPASAGLMEQAIMEASCKASDETS